MSRIGAPMGHEYRGIVEEVGNAVSSIKPGRFVREEPIEVIA
jgi:Zn-dependent alcohol dehydrogenase